MKVAEMVNRIRVLEAEIHRLRARNGELFVALQESAPERINMDGVNAGQVVEKGCK